MNNIIRTNLETSKQLREWGCDLESENDIRVCSFCYDPLRTNMICRKCNKKDMMNYHLPAYDLLWDVCVKYPAKFFGETGYYIGNKYTGIVTTREASEKNEEYYKKYGTNLYFRSYEEISNGIVALVRGGLVEVANEYLLEHTIFNPKNK